MKQKREMQKACGEESVNVTAGQSCHFQHLFVPVLEGNDFSKTLGDSSFI